jgi:hypothetical protein
MQIEEKRQFSRVSLVAEAKLIQSGQCWLGHVVDISFKGVLINSPSPFIFKNNKVIIAEIFLRITTASKLKSKERVIMANFMALIF